MDISGKSFYISVDLEGCACTIGTPGQGLAAGTAGYEFACLQGTREANAAAEALFSLGAGEVWIWDSHGTGFNLRYDRLDSRCRIVLGAGSKKRFPGIDGSFGGVLFIGAHAHDASDATLCHVYSSASYQYQRINGAEVGETEIDAAIAGKAGVPVLLVSSDDICVSQAKNSFPDAGTVVTKKALAWNSCISLHPDKVCEMISAEVKRVCALPHPPKPFTISEPFDYEVRFKRIEAAQSCSLRNPDNIPFSRPDAYTRCGRLARIEDIFEF